MDRTASVTRFVITHVSDKDGLRTLTLPCQGRNTYPTAEYAQLALNAFQGPSGLRKVLSAAEMDSLEVRPCECWPEHFDPKGVYFDD